MLQSTLKSLIDIEKQFRKLWPLFFRQIFSHRYKFNVLLSQTYRRKTRKDFRD